MIDTGQEGVNNMGHRPQPKSHMGTRDWKR